MGKRAAAPKNSPKKPKKEGEEEEDKEEENTEEEVADGQEHQKSPAKEKNKAKGKAKAKSSTKKGHLKKPAAQVKPPKAKGAGSLKQTEEKQVPAKAVSLRDKAQQWKKGLADEGEEEPGAPIES